MRTANLCNKLLSCADGNMLAWQNSPIALTEVPHQQEAGHSVQRHLEVLVRRRPDLYVSCCGLLQGEHHSAACSQNGHQQDRLKALLRCADTGAAVNHLGWLHTRCMLRQWACDALHRLSRSGKVAAQQIQCQPVIQPRLLVIHVHPIQAYWADQCHSQQAAKLGIAGLLYASGDAWPTHICTESTRRNQCTYHEMPT